MQGAGEAEENLAAIQRTNKTDQRSAPKVSELVKLPILHRHRTMTVFQQKEHP